MINRYFGSYRLTREPGRHISITDDPAKGLKYNKINGCRHVSKKIWDVDIARSPQVIKSIMVPMNVQGEAWVAHRYNALINYESDKVNGRGR